MSKHTENKKYTIHFGYMTRKVMKYKNVSVTSLSKELGITKSTLSYHLRKRHLNSEMIYRMSKILDHDLFQYLYQPEEPPFNRKYLKQIEELRETIETHEKSLEQKSDT